MPLDSATIAGLRELPMEKAIMFWDGLEELGRQGKTLPAVVRELCQVDLFYLLVRACKRVDMLHPWVYARVREVEASPDDHLDLWSREHYKTTTITFGLTIQNILKDPEITVGIFSHTRPIAKAFLRQIMRELEANSTLHAAFPDILWGLDVRQSPKWSEDDGIIVKRKSNPNEATIEAWGLVDGQPTSKHFKVMLYDDIVVQASTTTPDMIQKTMTALEQSYNLGTTPGIRRFAGTRWHFNDAYSTIIKRGTVNLRMHPATIDGTEDGEPVYWTREQLAQKRRDMGPYTFCLGAGMRVLMADWSWKSIESVAIGDDVVGYEFGKNHGLRTSLVSTKVVATSKMLGELNEYTLESGKKIQCTPNHKWWSGRSSKDTHRVYAALGENGYRDLHGLVKITDVFEKTGNDIEAWGWLAGIIDGEGTISPNGQVMISQSPEHNPEVCARIESVLAQLGIEYSTCDRLAGTYHGRKTKIGRIYVLNGGRPFKHKLISNAKLAKSQKIIDRGLYGKVGGKHSLSCNEKVISVCSLGVRPVFNLETATGNYIAEGYASKNSAQMLLNPKADAMQGFKREWLQYYKVMTPQMMRRMNLYILVDAANAKRKESDYTAIWVIGLNTDKNIYALDLTRDRLNLSERTNCVMNLHRKFSGMGCNIVQVRYERYGLMADIDHIKTVQETENYRFSITEVAGRSPKDDRIKRLIGIFEAGNFYLPETHYKTDYERIPRDLVHDFIEEEYMAFPVSAHKDMMDSLSRIAEPDVPLVWPQHKSIVHDEKSWRPSQAAYAT